MSKTFLLRKLHQLSGIAPLGLFLFAHFFTNSKAMVGERVFNEAVEDIHHLPALILIEIFGIFLPLAYHAIYGIVITAEARPNNLHYPYPRNWFYTIQRITGIILFFFILFHLLHFRFGLFGFMGLTKIPVAGNAIQAYTIVARDFAIAWVMIWYIAGISATVWHLANGFWLFAVDWGIVIGERAQKAFGYLCMAIGLGLLGMGINAAISFVRSGGLLGGILY
jgi:succinate dehydrogenase/fumarate reductase cytochrome b subunit (b558 family)